MIQIILKVLVQEWWQKTLWVPKIRQSMNLLMNIMILIMLQELAGLMAMEIAMIIMMKVIQVVDAVQALMFH